MAIFKGRTRVRYGYSRWGYTRNNGKGWHGGSDEEGLDSDTIPVSYTHLDVYKRQGYRKGDFDYGYKMGIS